MLDNNVVSDGAMANGVLSQSLALMTLCPNSLKGELVLRPSLHRSLYLYFREGDEHGYQNLQEHRARLPACAEDSLESTSEVLEMTSMRNSVPYEGHQISTSYC